MTNLYKVVKSSTSVGWGLQHLLFLSHILPWKRSPFYWRVLLATHIPKAVVAKEESSCGASRHWVAHDEHLAKPKWHVRAWPKGWKAAPTSLNADIKWNLVKSNLPSTNALPSFSSDTSKSDQLGVPSLHYLRPDDLRWSWYNKRNKVHNKYNTLASSPNHLTSPSVEKLSSMKPVPGLHQAENRW